MSGLGIALIVLGLVNVALGTFFLARPDRSVDRLVATGEFSEERARTMIRRRGWGGLIIGGVVIAVVVVMELRS